MTARRWLLLALAAAVVLLLAGRALAQGYVDYQWYASLGAEEVWRAKAGSTALLLLSSWIVATLFVFANLYAVRHSIVSLVLPRRIGGVEIGEEVPGSYLTGGVITISVLLGAFFTLPQSDWSTFLAARSHTPFGEPDPYLDADLGFYVYWLPFETRVYFWTLISIFIITALVLFIYALTPSLKWERGTLYVSAYVRRHITVLAGVLLVMLAWSYRLDRYGLLTSGSGQEHAFVHVDHVIGLPGSLILAVITLGAAFVVIWAGWTGQIRMAAGAIAGILILSLVVRQLVPFIAGRLGDDRDPRVRERPYDATRAGYTRRAFAVDRIEPAGPDVRFATLNEMARGVSAWDAAAITLATERSRPVSVLGFELGWHSTPAGLVADVPARGRSGAWSLARALATSADEHGGLLHVGSNGVPTPDELPLATPLVHDSAAGLVIVADSSGRIAGMPLDNGASRVALAWSMQRPALLFDDLPEPRPTALEKRDVRERVGALLPFFTQGTLISPIVASDSLYWVVDLYSASSTYPLSRGVIVAGDERTYFQHAATAIVQAVTGRVRIVADSALDPIASNWVRRFPGLFTPPNSLSFALRSALPPAIDALYAQAVALGRYGTRTDSDLPRHIPAPAEGADSLFIGPDAPFMLPSGTTASAIPLLGDQADRVRAIVFATGGPSRRTYWYALPDAGPRWSAIIDRLRGNDVPAVREAGTLHGAVRAIPVADDIVFVQSAYVARAEGAPTLSHVSLLYRDSLRTGPNVMQIVGGLPTGPSPTPNPTVTGDVRTRADSLYKVMRDALRRGDWATFGQAFDALGRLLQGGGTSK
jgi:uncharacterized protein